MELAAELGVRGIGQRLLIRDDLESGDYVPVAALGIVSKLLYRIPRRQALDTPLFGHNVLVASHYKDFGVRHHCRRCIHAADILRENLHATVADSEPSFKRKVVIARIKRSNFKTVSQMRRAKPKRVSR